MTLPISVRPHPDEHLPGVVVRAANAMGYDFSSEILIPLGFKSRAESVASAPHLKLALADHLGCTLEDLAPHFVERDDRSGWIKFYGAYQVDAARGRRAPFGARHPRGMRVP